MWYPEREHFVALETEDDSFAGILMTLQILYFAGLRDLVGTSKETLEVDESVQSVKELLGELVEQHPELRLDGVRVAVNEEFQSEDARISNQDVVALIPPVSGG